MSNQAVSVAEDLMVGAGELYFFRNGDPHGFHHLGNVEEFTITNDVTTVEKNSSMNKRRELMASVSTAISSSASITMNEYNPYNMALGLYGTENVHTQAATQLVNASYVIESVPGILTLEDADGNRYFNVSNVSLSTGTTTPAGVSWSNIGAITGNVTGASISSGTNSNDTITDGDGTKIVVGVGSDTSTSSENIYVVVTSGNLVAGSTNGITLKVQEGIVGSSIQVLSYTGGAATETQSTLTGRQITITVDSTNLVTPASSTDSVNSNFMNWGTFVYTPRIPGLVEGVDYILDSQRLRGGVITIPLKSKLSAGQTVYVSADIPEATYPTVSGANAGEIEGRLLFLGDPDIGGNYIIEGWKVKVTPDGDFTGLISDDFGSYQLTVRFLADYENHPNCPFYRATMVSKSSGTSASESEYNPRY